MEKLTPAEQLLEAVEALCKVYVGKNAPSEQWRETIDRFVELDKLAKKVRRAQRSALKKEAEA